tara:strand:+ start:15384 stop:17213 length:1830 start_codon:yes stop_codon:yes gene_type:complete
MSRVILTLFLVASLVSGVLFFTPNYSAEYDDDYYEYQPFLQYDFSLHELDIKNYDENDTQEFSGHVYMRREYSNEESETFRKLLVKNYQLFILDEQYRKEVGLILDNVANGTDDADDAIKSISNLTISYDGKARLLINENATFENLITLEMISWVRDNFIIESMIDGVPRGLMSQRIVKVNESIASSDSSAEKIGAIHHEMLNDNYNHAEEVIPDGPVLKINGINAVWDDWEFESVGPTSSLLGSFSDKSNDRLWIGQWMHVSFPNSSHTLGSHTLTFEWPDEDFKGKETNFYFGLGYGEVFTNIDSESTNIWPHVTDNYYKPPYDWIGFSAENGTVGKLEATFGQGFANHAVYDWHEAAEYAETLTYEGVSGHLATITSKEEAALIFSLLDGQSYWLGGFHNMSNPNYMEPSDGWEWVTGENFSNDFWAEGEPNEAGPEDCLEVWGFDKVLNDNRCHVGWTGMVVEFEMNGTNHYEALIPQWVYDDKNETEVLTYVKAIPLTDEERNEILKEEGDPDVDNDGIVDQFDEDDDNDGILDENDMDDDNDGIDDDSDRCPGTPIGELVDIEGCSSSQILKEVTEDGNIPGFNLVLAIISVSIIAYIRKASH